MPVNWGRDPVEKSGEEVHKMLLFLAFLAPQPNLLQRRPATCCTLPKGRRTHYFSLRRDLSTWQSTHWATDILMIVSYLPTLHIFLLHSCFSLPSPCITVLPIYVGFHTIFFLFAAFFSTLTWSSLFFTQEIMATSHSFARTGGKNSSELLFTFSLSAD